jgi:hypothetical protein
MTNEAEVQKIAAEVDALVQTEAKALAQQPVVLQTSEAAVGAPTPVIISRPSTSLPPASKAVRMPAVSQHPLREWQKRALAKQRSRK